MEIIVRKLVINIKLIVDWLIAQVVICSFKLIHMLPFLPTAAAASRVAQILSPILPRRRVVMENLRHAFPELTHKQRKQILRGMWDNLARSAVEFIHLDKVMQLDPGDIDPGRVKIIAHRQFFELRDSGKPAIVVAAHLANWEIMPISAALLGLNVVSVFRPPNNRFVARFILKARSAHAGRLVPTMAGAGYEIMGVLERGGIVGQLVDQRFRRGARVPFLGRLAKTNTFPAKLARQFDCPVYGARVVRLPNSRFTVEMIGPIDLPRDPKGHVDVELATAKIASVVEGWIREHPAQWLWMHRRWD